MKIFPFLCVLFYGCNATFLNLFGGKESGTDSASAKPSQGKSYGRQINHFSSFSPNNYHSHNRGGLFYSNGHSYGTPYSSSNGKTEIFKVITQSSVGPGSLNVDHSHSIGASPHFFSGSSHITSGYRQDDTYSAQFYAILPQILEIILRDHEVYTSGGSGNNLYSHLLAHFGRKGTAVVTSGNSKSGNLYTDGHVIERGVLKVKRVK